MLLWPNMARMEYLVPLVVLLLFGALGGYVIINGGQLIPNDGDDQQDDGNEQRFPAEWNVFYVVAGGYLPDCDATKLGRLYYVEAESAFYVCKSDGWMFIDLTGAQGEPGQAGADGTWTPGRKNIPPAIHLSFPGNIGGTESYSSSTGDFLGYIAYNFSVYREVVDLDGSISSAGWDIDLNGQIDHASSATRSVDTVSVPLDNWMNASSIIGTTPDSTLLLTTVAFMATDDAGDTTAELLTLVIDTSTLTVFGYPTGYYTTLNTYYAEDADNYVSSGTSDILIRLQLSGLDDLSWTFTQIQLSVGDTVHKCTVGGGDACTISQQGGWNGNSWEPGEYIFLSESGTDICSDVLCTVGISVTYMGMKVLGPDSITVDHGVPTVNTYDADDANADASSGSSDNLIRLQMTGTDTLSWTFTEILLSVGDTVHKCTVGGGDACTISQQGGDNGNAWEPGEFIFLSESGTDICSDVGCNVGISVTYAGYTLAGDGAVVVD
jgi:hypothetical protein